MIHLFISSIFIITLVQAQVIAIKLVTLTNNKSIYCLSIDTLEDTRVELKQFNGEKLIYDLTDITTVSTEKYKLNQLTPLMNLEPRRYPIATLVGSALMPGLGQILNEDYDKVAIIYGGFLGGMLLSMRENRKPGLAVALLSYFYSIIDAPISSIRSNNQRNDQISKLLSAQQIFINTDNFFLLNLSFNF